MNNAEETAAKTLSERAEALLKNLQETLNEEKWTRATLGNYSANQFKELDEILKTAKNEKIINELKKDCDDHLSHTSKSIIALYLSGMIALSRQIIDDSTMIHLVEIFLDNHKWSIVKYLCERILDYGESKFALRTLAECYKNDNEEELVYGIWERLVKADFEEAEIAKALGDHYEKQGKKETAIDYYKKALHRFINKGNFNNVREIWEKLLELNVEDIDFFLHIQKKIAKNISEDKTVILLNELYAKYKDMDIDISINILKIILDYDEKDHSARKEITECFKTKYADHSHLEKYIQVSNLSQAYRNVHEAISIFEKHIAFDKGNYVYHRTWGVGRISAIEGENIKIDFAKKRGHSMALKMAVDALQTLSKNHIWVLKATMKKDELRDKVKNDIIWTLKTIIKSFENSCDMKKIKLELSPALLTTGEWTTWSAKAREIIKSNPEFGVNPDNIDVITVRDRPISITEKYYNEFNAQKTFFDKAAVIRDFANNKEADLESDYFAEMVLYFSSILKSTGQDSANIPAAYILLKELSAKHSHIASSITVSFEDVFAKIKDVSALFKTLKDAKFKEEFLINIKQNISDWPQIYIKLFPYALNPFIITHLSKEGYEDKLTVMCNECFENFRETREAVVWLYKNSRDAPWFKAANITYEKQLITLIHILDLTYRDIENNKNTVENRKINKLVHNILFKDGSIANYLDGADEDTIIRIFTFINNVKDLDPQDKLNLRSKILDKHPGFKFFGEAEKKVTRGLIVTMAMFEEKKRQLTHIMDEEVPANSKEIEYALSLGDLRENAEYKAAKEKQEQLNSQVAKLKEEIEKAQIFDPNSVNTSKASFGTTVLMQNETTGKKEEFTILGPWESEAAFMGRLSNQPSNLDNNIISYLSPFGNAILNKTQGERFDFTINDEKVTYVVESITPAKI